MIVSNATPLIYLARIGQLDLLREVYSSVIISEEVKKEVVDKGKEAGKEDAYIIENAISDGWIKVEKSKGVKLQIELDPGEASTIGLAKSKGINNVLIDESSGRTAARLVGLEPKGTIFVLLKAIELKLIDFNGFLALSRKLVSEGFRLKEEVYIEAIEKARDLSKSAGHK